MGQNALAGYRNGGRAPYGYQRKPEPHTNPARAAAVETKSRLVIGHGEAPERDSALGEGDDQRHAAQSRVRGQAGVEPT